ncbi:MAG: tetratricopeptide repeat protein [Pseudomonadota bacterium]
MKRSTWLTLALLATAFAVYGISLRNPLYFDDLTILLGNTWLYKGSFLNWFVSPFLDFSQNFPGYRPLLMMSFAANVRLLGDSAAAIRIVNLLLHAFNALLLARILSRLIRDESMKWMAWGAAFLFLLHPIQTLGVNFLWKRSTLLSVFFILAGVFWHVRERQRFAAYRWRSVLAQGLILVVAFFCKEDALVLGPLLLLVDLCFFRERKTWLGLSSLALYLLLAALSLLLLWFRLSVVNSWIVVLKQSKAVDRRGTDRFTYLLFSADVVRRYLLLWLVPKPLLLDDPSPLKSFPWAGLVAYVLSVVGTVLLVIRFRAKPIVWFALGMFWIGLAPTTGPLPIYLVMDQIRMYLPLAGLCFLLVFGLDAAARKVRAAPLLLVCAVGVAYGAESFLQNLRYRHPIAIWGDVLEEYPESGMAWEYMAASMDMAGLEEEKAFAWDMAGRVESGAPIYRVFQKLMKLEKVSSKERKKGLDAINFSDFNPRQLVNIATWEAKHGEEKRAEAHFLEAIGRNPWSFTAHFNLGILSEKLGKLDQARRAFSNALFLAPQDPRAQAAVKRLGRPAGPPEIVLPH